MNLLKALRISDGFSRMPVSGILFRATVLLLLVTSYLPVFSLYARQHWSDMNLQGAYAHAPLAILVIAFLIWRQRKKLSEPMLGAQNPGGLLLLASGVCLKIYGDVQGYVVLQGMSLIPVLLGLLRTYYGADTLRAVRFPVLLLFFVIPLPGAAIDALTMPLVEVAAELVATVLPMLNIDVVKAGHTLTVNSVGLAEYHEVILAAECSGIRSFVSLLALSSIFAHLQGRGFGHSTMLMLMTIPLVILGNCIRVTLTILMIVFVSPDTAQTFFHWSSGLLLFTVALFGLFIIDAMLSREFSGKESSHG
jgi:exosortase